MTCCRGNGTEDWLGAVADEADVIICIDFASDIVDNLHNGKWESDSEKYAE